MNSRGQSLIEVLVAMAIISGAFFYLVNVKGQTEKRFIQTSRAFQEQNELLNIVKQLKVLEKMELLSHLDSIPNFKFSKKISQRELYSQTKKSQLDSDNFFVTFHATDSNGTLIHEMPKTLEEALKLQLSYTVESNVEHGSSKTMTGEVW